MASRQGRLSKPSRVARRVLVALHRRKAGLSPGHRVFIRVDPGRIALLRFQGGNPWRGLG